MWGISDDEELVLKRKLVKVLGKKECYTKYNHYIIGVSSDVSFEIVRIYQFILNTKFIL